MRHPCLLLQKTRQPLQRWGWNLSKSQAQDCRLAVGHQQPGAEPMCADSMTYMMYVGLQRLRMKGEGKEKSICHRLGYSPAICSCDHADQSSSYFWVSGRLIHDVICAVADISIAAVDLLQEMTDVETDDDNKDAINAFFDALVSITFLQGWYQASSVYFISYISGICLLTQQN